ncbi:MAG TPA: HD domain-containing phosphohydrolase, partial [Candidatus Acidoferrum sp.]|nr:HD domain-containing phosphohydrolase [Candidatus Acidoferrum sp.]
GLRGDDIPLSCRIVAVSDCFDALLSQRPYKKPWPLDEAKAYMFAEAGRHFDPEVIRAFDDVLPEIIRIRDSYQDSQADDSKG